MKEGLRTDGGQDRGKSVKIHNRGQHTGNPTLYRPENWLLDFLFFYGIKDRKQFQRKISFMIIDKYKVFLYSVSNAINKGASRCFTGIAE